MILAARVVADAGLEQSRAFVDDNVWTSNRAAIGMRFAAKGYLAEEVEDDGTHDIERRCLAIGDVWAWLDTLDPEDD